jgi:hypothetical protein
LEVTVSEIPDSPESKYVAYSCVGETSVRVVVEFTHPALSLRRKVPEPAVMLPATISQNILTPALAANTPGLKEVTTKLAGVALVVLMLTGRIRVCEFVVENVRDVVDMDPGIFPD